MPLRLVPATDPTPAEKVRHRLRRTDKPATMLECPRCAGRETMEVRTGVMLKNGKPTGGTKQIACATCHMKGERVILA